MTRFLFFEDGAFAYTDASQAGGGFDTEAHWDGNVTIVRIDSETYLIDDTVIRGK